jgi:hypothetical protein
MSWRRQVYLSQTRSKYGAVKVELDGHVFDSKAEARRYGELLLLRRAWKISHLVVHPRIPLVVSGVHLGDYIGDFEYQDSTGQLVLEDVKSPATKTPLYKLKKKLVEALFERTITEVEYR